MSALGTAAEPFDVVCLGEVLLEVATEQPYGHDVPAVLGISGDVLNVAAAAAAAGARVGLVAVLGDDELGQAITRRVVRLGVSPELLRYRSGQQGIYLVHSDPAGERQFSYARSGSVGSTLGPEDLPSDLAGRAGAVVASGIICAVSGSGHAAVRQAAREARRFVFDPNFRPRLTTADRAAASLTELAPLTWLMTPSFPGETSALLGVETAVEAGRRLRRLGTANVAVTCGADGVQLVAEGLETWIPAVPAERLVDQTGAGDAFVGTLTARLVLGDPLELAAAQAAAAASLAVGGRGGTGLVPTLEQTRRHLARANEAS